MNKLLAISIASASIAIGAIPALAEVDAKTHKLCIEAKDYLGCVKAMKGEITSGVSNSRSNAKARTKEFKDKLYEFNKRQYIVENPHLAEWVSANPAAARKVINEELRFFSEKDLAKLRKEADAGLFRSDLRLCINRGKAIDSQFDWTSVCQHDQSYGDDLDSKNELFYRLILEALSTQERDEIKQRNCENEGKKIRLTSSGEACMSDYEYAAFEQREQENEATERFRLQLESDREAERRRRALQDGLEGLRRITDSFNQNQPVNCFGSATTFGSTTFGNSTCY